jgi:hypothetical protein
MRVTTYGFARCCNIFCVNCFGLKEDGICDTRFLLGGEGARRATDLPNKKRPAGAGQGFRPIFTQPNSAELTCNV